MDWLDTLTFPTEKKYENVEYAKAVYGRVVQTTLNAGTTMACYYGTLHLSATNALVSICREKGQRALIGKCSMDRNSPDCYVEETEEAMKSIESFVSTFTRPSDPKELVRPILTPRMAISVTPELLSNLSRLAKTFDPPLSIQTHLSENDQEIKTTGELFPDSKDYTSVYDDFGLLGPRTILAHCVHLTKEERGLIKRRNAGISHCPTSNFFIGSGNARVREMLDEGIKVISELFLFELF